MARAYFPVVILLLVGVVGTPVLADGLPLPPVTMKVTWDNGIISQEFETNIADLTDPAVESVSRNPDGTYQLIGGWDPGPSEWTASWNLTIDPDPVVFGGFTFTNMIASPQDFSVSLTLPTTVPSPAQMRGTIAGSLLDANGDGAVLTTQAGEPLYAALIDNVPVKTLLDDPFSTTVGPAASGVWPTPPAAFGYEPAPAVTTMIGINHLFTLSGTGDTATFVSRFEVIPEPATLGLLLVGAMSLLRRRVR
jgi:hypothetical protein